MIPVRKSSAQIPIANGARYEMIVSIGRASRYWSRSSFVMLAKSMAKEGRGKKGAQEKITAEKTRHEEGGRKKGKWMMMTPPAVVLFLSKNWVSSVELGVTI
jgi:hypothetical protein